MSRAIARPSASAAARHRATRGEGVNGVRIRCSGKPAVQRPPANDAPPAATPAASLAAVACLIRGGTAPGPAARRRQGHPGLRVDRSATRSSGYHQHSPAADVGHVEATRREHAHQADGSRRCSSVANSRRALEARGIGALCSSVAGPSSTGPTPACHRAGLPPVPEPAPRPARSRARLSAAHPAADKAGRAPGQVPSSWRGT